MGIKYDQMWCSNQFRMDWWLAWIHVWRRTPGNLQDFVMFLNGWEVGLRCVLFEICCTKIQISLWLKWMAFLKFVFLIQSFFWVHWDKVIETAENHGHLPRSTLNGLVWGTISRNPFLNGKIHGFQFPATIFPRKPVQINDPSAIKYGCPGCNSFNRMPPLLR